MKSIIYIIGGIAIIAGGVYAYQIYYQTDNEETIDNTDTVVDADENTNDVSMSDEPMSNESDEGMDDEAQPNDEPLGNQAQIEAAQALDLEGMSEDEAAQVAAENDVMFRVVERDGEPLAMTMDYRPGRINATVEGGVVTSYTIEGMGN
jgi:hypothetical protein